MLFDSFRRAKRGVKRNLEEPSYQKHISIYKNESVDIKNEENELKTTKLYPF